MQTVLKFTKDTNDNFYFLHIQVTSHSGYKVYSTEMILREKAIEISIEFGIELPK